MKAAIMQPTYLPWIGYFDLMDQVDVLVLLDDVEFSKRSWQQRNRILGPGGKPMWLTVPVRNNGKQLIRDVRIDSSKRWQEKHHKSILMHYSRAPYLDRFREWFEEIYEQEWVHLKELNTALIEGVAGFMDLSVDLVFASQLSTGSGRTERLVEVCQAVDAEAYVSPIGSLDYLDPTPFERDGIELEFQNFVHPEYTQIVDGFVSHLSVLDLLFNAGDQSLDIIRMGRRASYSHPQAMILLNRTKNRRTL